jgi:hypothetical protein
VFRKWNKPFLYERIQGNDSGSDTGSEICRREQIQRSR